MKWNNLFRFRPKATSVQTSTPQLHPYATLLQSYLPLMPPDGALYSSLREAVPIIDDAMDKIVRLSCGFSVEVSDSSLQAQMDEFIKTVKVGYSSYGLNQFVQWYLDDLLTYGNAVGEIVLDQENTEIAALFLAKLDSLSVLPDENNLSVNLFTKKFGHQPSPLPHPELVLFTPFQPPSGEVLGVSLLRSLPFVSDILLKIYQSIGTNFQRVANLRYAVTYHPNGSQIDRSYAEEIADTIATEWQDAMTSQKSGVMKDFVAVGDVDIKVIGADNQMIDTEVPVRQMLEQIVAKLGIPPFMLGLHWSSTERMSTQQADILTSELDSYRFLLEPVILKICSFFLRLKGSGAKVNVVWQEVNLQDQIESANVRLLNAQAQSLEQQNGGELLAQQPR